eukprot:TRINITY_DN1395_c1_g1_i1.p1 TRINITY_DN1395_c1_g1~~TRINITY_DN1395_c1_g1_i1.p1  ORF type:complete len:191 (+),score=40.49 TRINITY_DN1395_c1_g1_i1:139-711(+)
MSKVPNFAPSYKLNDSHLMNVINDGWKMYHVNVEPIKGFTIEFNINKLIQIHNTWGIELGCVYTSQIGVTQRKCIGKSIGVCYVAFNGKLEHCCDNGHNYANPYGAGDLVKMNVYSDKRVEYFLNGESQGICFTLEEFPVVPTVCISAEAEVELISFYELDDDIIPEESSIDKRDQIPQKKYLKFEEILI